LAYHRLFDKIQSVKVGVGGGFAAASENEFIPDQYTQFRSVNLLHNADINGKNSVSSSRIARSEFARPSRACITLALPREFRVIRFTNERLWTLSGHRHQQHPYASVSTAIHQCSAAGLLKCCNRGQRDVLAAEHRD
jgi:hypothetical protein